MAPRSEYILYQTLQLNRSSPDKKVTQDNDEFTNEGNDSTTISLFKQNIPHDKLLDMQIDGEDSQQNTKNKCFTYNSKVKRKLLPELEFEAFRLGPSGPWFTIPKSQYKINQTQCWLGGLLSTQLLADSAGNVDKLPSYPSIRGTITIY